MPEVDSAEFIIRSSMVDERRRRDPNCAGLPNDFHTAWAKTVKFGQIITFVERQIVDWLYMDNGRMQGNFTLCVLLKREPPDQAKAFMKQYGLSCGP